jgi:uncharacterized membrane protein
MKGVSQAVIISLIFLIVVMLFLILTFTIFKEKSQEASDVFRNLFKQALKGVK